MSTRRSKRPVLKQGALKHVKVTSLGDGTKRQQITAPVISVATAIANIQAERATIGRRSSVILNELNGLNARSSSLETRRLELLRELDKTSA